MPETRNATEPAFVGKPLGFVRLQYIAVQDDPNVAFVGRDDGFELEDAYGNIVLSVPRSRAPSIRAHGDAGKFVLVDNVVPAMDLSQRR